MINEPLEAIRLAAHGAWKFAQVHLRKSRPFILNHLITVRCNLKCPFCYVSGEEQSEFNLKRYPKKTELTTAELHDFYEQLMAYGFKLFIIVGGEPLLRPDLDDVLSRLVGRAYASVFTNGWSLNDRLDLLRHADHVFSSLDAPDDYHDELRNKKNCFKRAVAGIEELQRKYPKITTAIMCTVTDQNAHRVGDMIAFSREMKLPVAFQPVTYEGLFALEDRPQDEGAKRIPPHELVSQAFRTIKEQAKSERIVGSNTFFDHVIENRPTYACHYPSYVLGPVYPNGDVVGCVTSEVIANVRNQKVKDILDGEAYKGNAAAGPTCPIGCRDWGIHDISAVHNRQFQWDDLGRLFRGFVTKAAKGLFK
jgi:MoaA/NifB/PqqE/SkfB family radical SAM enzyme